MAPITEPAPAKINLALHIRRKRSDGYHDLETLFAFARDGDVVTVAPAERDSFTITGPFASALAITRDPLSTPAKAGVQSPEASKGGKPLHRHGSWTPAFAGEENNLVVQAAVAFSRTFGCPPVAINLEKNLPIASGIGGGSADAAATLRALARLTGTDPADTRLLAIARDLGADVPACLWGQTAFATGRGDDLQPLPALGDLPLLLVNPGVPLSTAAMFAAWDGIDRGPIAASGSALERARAGRNDFTAPAVAHAPAIAAVLDLLNTAPGCTIARLSGSGATCFGLFANRQTRDRTAEQARSRGWWAMSTTAT
jgi:4-diphosphocytidyl-2-C-methyl-D-erythritol kinase